MGLLVELGCSEGTTDPDSNYSRTRDEDAGRGRSASLESDAPATERDDEKNPEAGAAMGTGSELTASESPDAELPADLGSCRLGDPSGFEPPRPTPRVIPDATQVSNSVGVTRVMGLFDGQYRDSESYARVATPSAEAPEWIAVNVPRGPTRLLLTWFDATSNIYKNLGTAPTAYRVEVSADSTDGADGSWTIKADVTDNVYRAHAHSIDFDGQSWLRFVVTAAQAGKATALDEIVLQDISDGDDVDNWAFSGDSITMGAFVRELGVENMFDGLIAADGTRNPGMISLGIGGQKLPEGLARLESDLDAFPHYRNVGIAFGTNDAWGNSSVGSFGTELEGMVEAVLADGRVPILARIPFSDSGSHAAVPEFNALIDALQIEYELPCGPDLYTWFKDHPDELGTDRVHPTATGYLSINRLWAEAALAFYAQ